MPAPRTRTETRTQRHARQAREAELGAAEREREAVADRARRLTRRRRLAGLVLAGEAALAMLVALVGAWVVSHVDGPDAQWWIGAGGRFSHTSTAVDVPVGQAGALALKVMAVPCALTVLTLLLLWLPRVRDRVVLPVVPMAVGAALAPGLAVSLLVSYTASALGQDDRDFLPAVAQMAPQVLGAVCLFGGLLLVSARAGKPLRRAARGRRG